MTAPALTIPTLDACPPRPLHWLWPGRIPLGKLTILSGDPSLGKSLLTLDLAARVSTAREWPGAQTQTDNSLSRPSAARNKRSPQADDSSSPPTSDLCPLTPDSCPLAPAPGRVLLLAAEDDLADTIRPRLEAAGADLPHPRPRRPPRRRRSPRLRLPPS